MMVVVVTRVPYNHALKKKKDPTKHTHTHHTYVPREVDPLPIGAYVYLEVKPPRMPTNALRILFFTPHTDQLAKRWRTRYFPRALEVDQTLISAYVGVGTQHILKYTVLLRLVGRGVERGSI